MYKINEKEFVYDIEDNQAIVINHKTGIYYGFNALSSYVINQIVCGASIDKIKIDLNANPDCPEKFSDEIDKFVSGLLELKIIVPTTETISSELSAEIPEEVFTDGFNLSIDAFDEARDLILADPIHDVDEDMGWPIMKN